jgi:tetratricopeptide (TPR) repeat protein
MRHNIEELAFEEENRLKEENWERVRGVSLLLGVGFGLWGWWRFSGDHLGSGALAILFSYVFFAVRWNAAQSIRVTSTSLIVGLSAASGLLTLYVFSALPSFYWGLDPSFWLAVHAGAVVEPVWSPLSYLVGEAVSYLFPSKVFTLLPVLSALVISLAVFVIAQELLSQFKSKSRLNGFFIFLVCAVVGLSRPFWTAGTMASGLVSGLGLLLFLLHRHALQLGKEQSSLSTFLLGLLWSVHPLWGAIGTIAFWAHEEIREDLDHHWFALLLGFSPYLWVFFRAGKNFPSWGGTTPFLEIPRSLWGLWRDHFTTDWSCIQAAGSLGWVTVILLVLAGVLGLFNLVMGVEISKKLVSQMDFWVWAFCGTSALLFYSKSTDLLAPLSLWLVTGTAGFFSFSFDRRAGVSSRPGSKQIIGIAALAVLLMACGLAWLPGQSQVRDQYFFPQQHALNLIRPLGEKSLLICDSPFDYYGSLEARWMEPSSQPGAVLFRSCLDKRWYLSQWIAQEPELLFSSSSGNFDLLVKSLVLNNRDRWQIHWARLGLPADWAEPKASPTGLTEFFQSDLGSVDPASFQFRYDLSLIPIHQEGMDERTATHLSSYVEGFKLLGKSLLEQGRYTDAIRAYDRAARLDPLDRGSMDQLALIYSQHNLLEAAQLDYEKILKTHPPAIEQMMKALDNAQAAKDEAKAADCLGQWVKLNAELADAQYQLSKIYEHQGRAKEAKALLEASVQVNPKQVEAQLTLGHFMEKSNERAKAEEAFRSVLLVDPQNKEAQVELWKLLNPSKR